MFQNSIPMSNISSNVEFIARGAKKRRAMAYTNIKMIQSEMGVTKKLAAVK